MARRPEAAGGAGGDALAGRIGAHGHSVSWEGGKKAALDLLAAYLAADHYAAVAGKGVDDLTVDDWLDMDLYDYFCGWATKVALIPRGRKNAGKPYDDATIVNYVQTIMNYGNNLLQGKVLDPAVAAKVSLFFTCLQPNATTKSAIWFKKLRKQVSRYCFERDKAKGEQGRDEKASPIYIDVQQKRAQEGGAG